MRAFSLFVACMLPLSLFSQNTEECLNFNIKFGIIKGGEAYYTISDTVFENHKALTVRLYGHTSGFADLLYNVNDYFESIVNKENFYPLKSIKKLHEQKYRFYNEVVYYHDRDSAFSEKTGWQKIMPGVCDVSSLLYKVRFSEILDNLVKNEIIELPFWDTGGWYIIKVQYAGTETIKTKFGEKECIVMKPLNIEGNFFSKKRPLEVWFTKDKQHLPLLLKLNFTIGSIKCELVNEL